MTSPRSQRTEPTIDAALDSDATPSPAAREPGAYARAPGARRGPVAALFLLMLLVAGAVFFYLWRPGAPRPDVVATPAVTPPPVESDTASAIRHPIESVKSAADTDAKPLPALMVSDTTMQNTLADLFGAESLGKVFYPDTIIHRFVATIDNLPRKSVPSRNLPVKPAAGPLITSSKDGTLAISAENAARYTPYVRLAEAIDAGTVVAAYAHFYPLMQQDYRDLGYPKGYFNDRLVEAIDDLLAAPDMSDLPQLVQPKVLYQYADPELEARSAGQKIMMRMGAENASKVKGKLRQIRAELVAPHAAPAAAKPAQ